MQDIWSDLQLFLTFNTVLLVLGAFIKTAVVDRLDLQFGGPQALEDSETATGFWANVYQLLDVVLGQDLPDVNASTVFYKIFAPLVATIGLVAFALVLALVEQLVLQVLEDNVKRGSRVFETGHILVLGYGENQRDEEVIWKVLSQVCLAYRNGEAKVVVVLCQREKLEMETTFRRIIPESQRFSTQFVFRQGSPLVPDDLRMVAASSAAATIIVSDSSRPPLEADAQALRAAVLLDELDFPGFGVADPRTGHIVVEVRTPNAVSLLKYSCSARVLALPSGQLNARRMARMVKQPVVGAISQMLWSFNSRSQGYLEYFPMLEGKRFDEIPYYFPDGSVFGLVNNAAQRCLLNPPADTRVQKGDALIMMRPTSIASEAYRPLPRPIAVTPGDWDPDKFVHCTQGTVPPLDAEQLPVALSGRATVQGSTSANASPQCSNLYMLPVEATSSCSDSPERVLILGWGDTVLMTDLLAELDHGPAALPRGSEVFLFNTWSSQEVMGRARGAAGVRNLSVLHIPGDPLQRSEIADRLDITRFKCCIILCDSRWVDPDLDSTNGIQMRLAADMLRFDSMLLMVQLNVRKLLEEAEYPDINILTEKVAFDGLTRFEDRSRLPLGISVNMTAYSARLLTQVAYNPGVMLPYSKLGEEHEVTVQDTSQLAAKGEVLSYWQLMARAETVGQILFAYFQIPSTMDSPLDLVVNPEGNEARSQRRVWNSGDSRCKLICLAPKTWRRDEDAAAQEMPAVSSQDGEDSPAYQRPSGQMMGASLKAARESGQLAFGSSQVRDLASAGEQVLPGRRSTPSQNGSQAAQPRRSGNAYLDSTDSNDEEAALAAQLQQKVSQAVPPPEKREPKSEDARKRHGARVV
eukprot:jgi/Astpho2/4631/Aster-x0209